MKRSLLLALGLALSLVAPSLRAADAPKALRSEHKKLEIWAGKWDLKETIFETPFGRPEQREYRWDVRLVHGGFCVEGHGKQRGTSNPLTWTEIHYFDPKTQAFRTFYADSDGMIGHGTDTVEGNTWAGSPWQWQVDGKTYHGKSVVTFSPDGKSQRYEWSYSEDGTTWKPWLTGTGKKAGKGK